MTTTPSKKMNVGLWVVQALVAVAFFGSGLMKLMTSQADLVAGGQAWAGRVPEALILFIGVAEVLGAVGVVLPALTRVQPKLTPLAAAGLVVVMVLAMANHLMAGEFMIVPNLVLGGLAAFVAWGRFKRAPIAPR